MMIMETGFSTESYQSVPTQSVIQHINGYGGAITNGVIGLLIEIKQKLHHMSKVTIKAIDT